jgi:hypothetical protein
MILRAAGAPVVLLGSLLNLGAVAEEVRGRGEDVVVFCAGFKGAFARRRLCAGRIVAARGGADDSAVAARLIADSFPTPTHAAGAYGPPGLGDICFARASVLPVVPPGMVDGVAESSHGIAGRPPAVAATGWSPRASRSRRGRAAALGRAATPRTPRSRRNVLAVTEPMSNGIGGDFSPGLA